MELWQGLDVEEKDLKSFVKRCNSATTLIPGPTGNVQAAMINRDKEHVQSTQEFARDIASATYERDFKSNPWLWAEQFIKFHGLLKEGKIANATQLASCKCTSILPFVACIVKQCKPNGLGDMQISIKDTSATVWASVHRKVLLNPKFEQDLTVGAVLLLHTVVAFSPRPRLCYVNITVRNIVKILKADICQPTDELIHATLKPDIVLLPCMDPKIDELLRKLVKPSIVTNKTKHGQGSSGSDGASSSTKGAQTTDE
ncbi:hypothetical protein DEO72_LG10g1397 [Vigna unguiculata]|uniref:Homologous recombination OB-fold protein OB-fold domain-containing protein n=1 Tax=Vigna unguiculata TaxID=3917 RepID=A0A4D6NBC6_VIGUN|nr:hypothetical protein DEO72_LG10g1397 [Vigna unguiculata]